jgi:hypothetical protein
VQFDVEIGRSAFHARVKARVVFWNRIFVLCMALACGSIFLLPPSVAGEVALLIGILAVAQIVVVTRLSRD